MDIEFDLDYEMSYMNKENKVSGGVALYIFINIYNLQFKRYTCNR